MTPPSSRVTYANVASTLALALAVGGGTAYAAGVVRTSDLADGAVTAPKLAKNAVVSKKVKNGSLKPADLAVTPVSRTVVRTWRIMFQLSTGQTDIYRTGQANCEPGEQVLGGGFDIVTRSAVDGQPNVTVLASRPSGPSGAYVEPGTAPTGWYVEARQNEGRPDAVDVWVICGS